jgi:hypothetical protein
MAGRRDGGGLAELARRFAEWRRAHPHGTRIPTQLWDWAVELAAEHGVSRTSASLKLGYYDLKKHVADKASTARRAEGEDASPTFLELPAGALGARCECTIELEKRDGARMRMELKGASAAELAAVSRAFWESA